jgi:hypothetical protein
MKKTQQNAILKALLAGEVISALTSLKDFGSLRLGARVFDIQKKYDIILNRKNLTGKTRYGTTYTVVQYWMSGKDIKKISKKLAQ